jgi:hypothetical protein
VTSIFFIEQRVETLLDAKCEHIQFMVEKISAVHYYEALHTFWRLIRRVNLSAIAFFGRWWRRTAVAINVRPGSKCG